MKKIVALAALAALTSSTALAQDGAGSSAGVQTIGGATVSAADAAMGAAYGSGAAAAWAASSATSGLVGAVSRGESNIRVQMTQVEEPGEGDCPETPPAGSPEGTPAQSCEKSVEVDPFATILDGPGCQCEPLPDEKGKVTKKAAARSALHLQIAQCLKPWKFKTTDFHEDFHDVESKGKNQKVTYSVCNKKKVEFDAPPTCPFTIKIPAISPDITYVCEYSIGQMGRVCNYESGVREGKMKGMTYYCDTHFTLDGKTVVTSSEAKRDAVWAAIRGCSGGSASYLADNRQITYKIRGRVAGGCQIDEMAAQYADSSYGAQNVRTANCLIPMGALGGARSVGSLAAQFPKYCVKAGFPEWGIMGRQAAGLPDFQAKALACQPVSLVVNSVVYYDVVGKTASDGCRLVAVEGDEGRASPEGFVLSKETLPSVIGYIVGRAQYEALPVTVRKLRQAPPADGIGKFMTKKDTRSTDPRALKMLVR